MRLALAALLLLAACGADDGPVLHSEVNEPIFATTCTNSACHSAAKKEGGLDLETDPAAALVDVAPSTVAAAARGQMRVAPGDLAKSFLYTKLTNPGPGDGEKMPTGSDLSEEKLELIRRWIEGGARVR